MTFISIVYNAFPEFRSLITAIPSLPLKARSLLIKQCQAQYDIPVEDPNPLPTITRLLDAHPQVFFSGESVYHRGHQYSLPLRNFLRAHECSVADPVQSALILDFLRGLPVENAEIDSFREAGWVKEIKLGWDLRQPSVNFRPFFFHTDDPIHPDIPHNPLNLIRIRNAFRLFKQRLIDNPPTWYPRATHKNMSRSTRREFEKNFPGSSLEGIAIFGQDDWGQVYAETGIMLEGDVELRQKWYASGAKPRTYAAMGGTSYRYCRHLQNFFTSLTNIFPSTNHISRLRPGRLYVPPISSPYYRIYDLTSFTSNMVEQKGFCDTLAEFMDGVKVYTVDEWEGPIERDLGEMLQEYNEYCVFKPQLSVERAPKHLQPPETVFGHGIASLLGIFGNLMTCTVAHYLIVSPVTDSFDEDNTAGDDGLVLEYGFSEDATCKAINIVGDWEPEKCFLSSDPAAICLKRPLRVRDKNLELLPNCVPPTLVSVVSYLLGEAVDSRFEMIGLDELEAKDRFAVVGLDLLRFLRTVYRMDYQNFPFIKALYQGFMSLVRSTLHVNAISFGIRHNVLWPVDPDSYDFFSVDPYEMWVRLNAGCQEVDVRGWQEIPFSTLRLGGDQVIGNSTPRLVFLEKLGMIRKERVTRVLNQEESYYYLLASFARKLSEPVVYRFTCLKDLPDVFLYD